MIVLATRSAGTLTWNVVIAAALTTLWWGVIIYLGLVLYRAFRRWRNR